jgi:ATP-dependent RNA helicase RhlE
MAIQLEKDFYLNSATLEQNPSVLETPVAGDSTPSTPRFTDFNLSDALKSRLSNAGFVIPTPVQAGAIPPALEGADILATASTGTGKTLSFLVPILQRLDATTQPSTRAKRSHIRALILLPTRELAMQVLEAYWKLMPGARHDAVLICGGLSENTQFDNLDRGPRLVVATPGRLEDFLRRREIDLSHVDMFVLDEVDRMLDMGFLPAIRRIVTAVPKGRQTMCYSATLDANIQEIVRDYVKNPVRIEIGTTSKPSDRVELRVYTVMQDQKLGLLNQMLNEEKGTFLVFSRTKHGADRIAKKLEKLGHDTNAIHGDRSQSQRTAALKGFATGKHRVLVATDVAARGIDVSDIAHVVNYDLPNASEDFVHRIGRTGRAGAKGVATSFVMPQERHDARKLERELKIKFEWREADKNIEKEERNKPLDLATLPAGASSSDPIQALLSLESRSWRGGDTASRSESGNDAGRSSFRKRRSAPGSAGRPQGHSRGNSGGSAHPGRNASHPRGAKKGSQPHRGNRGK